MALGLVAHLVIQFIGHKWPTSSLEGIENNNMDMAKWTCNPTFCHDQIMQRKSNT